ncbi:MAG TPA: tetratricopeptide repeat protein [Thermoanaerobaculia bacterium]|nr:tetratricopeptide repeat protein [Thermoanaerobaculia bacterium]
MNLPEIGETVANFQILERLGQGGMGVVYKAQDLRLGRFVALKFMAPGRDTDEKGRLRFLGEAWATSALDHPNVCTLYEISETEDGQVFLAMAFCEGETLRDRLRRGPLDPAEAVRIAAQIANGLCAAHARGIVHRDIKPSNIMVGNGQVKILDFGVARLTDQASLTQDGAAIGTLHYMAPELLFGNEVRPSADLWSLGVMLYEAIAGRLPFQGRSSPEVILAILNSAPPFEDFGPDLGRVLKRALAKSPRLRYESAEAMQADLLAAIPGMDSPTQCLRPPSHLARTLERQPLHNLPFPPLGDLLKGRSEELQTLDDALQEAGSAGLQSHVIHGLGGIGKTRLAVEHAWRNGRRYRAMLFVLADSPEGLQSGLAWLARADLLKLPERDAPAESEVVGAVLRWLRENSGWLLILDNVDTKEALLAVTRLLPVLVGGQVLITSRRRDWPAGVRRQSLDVISVAPATDYLVQRTARDRRREPDDVPQALRLAELLDGLPLALEQAAAYIAHTQMSLAEYLEVWESECDSALSWYDEGVMQYPASLAVTWQSTFRQLAPTAQALLRLTAHLAPDPIPVAMLESGVAVIHEAARRLCADGGQEVKPRPVRDDLAELTSLSLISRQAGIISVHRVVQEVIRQRIPEEDRTPLIELTLALVGQYGPEQAEEADTWPIWDLLRPHAVQILALAEEGGHLENHNARRLMGCLGPLLHAKGLYSEAEPIIRKMLEIDQKLFGENHIETASNLHNLGTLLRFMGRLDEAEPLLRRSMDLFFAHGRERHPDATKPFNALALLLMERHQWIEAEELLRKALALDQEAYEGNHASIALDLRSLAVLLTSMGRAPEAEPVIRRALQMSQEVHGKTHPKTARKLQILAGVLRDLGRPNEAEPLARQALENFERILGPHHPWTKSARTDLERLMASASPPCNAPCAPL